MEFETDNKPKESSGLTDEQRLQASAKRVVLTPIHEDISADAMSDEFVASQHILEPPIANVDSDTEATAPPVATEASSATVATSSNNHAGIIVASVIGGLVVVGVLVYLLVLR